MIFHNFCDINFVIFTTYKIRNGGNIMSKYKNSIVVLILFLFAVNSNIAQDNFEGEIKFKISSDGEEMLLNYFIKDDNLRMEMVENKEAVFINNSKGSFILMPEEKMYMDLNNSLFSKIPGMMGMEEDENEDTEIEDIDIDKYRTGKTMTILGYNCYQWIFKEEEEEEEVEAWVTDELGNFMLMSGPMGGGYSPGWGSSVNNNGFFPLLVITKDEDGEVTSRFEATEIDEKSLDTDLFTPPSDYSEMKIPGM